MRSGIVNALRHSEGEPGKRLLSRCEEKVKQCLFNGLDSHDFYMIEDAAIKDGGEVKEYAHIVIGDSGAFIIQTQDFGDDYKNEGFFPTDVYVGRDSKWTARFKDGEIELENPTEQVLEQKAFMENAVEDMFLEVHPLVVIPEDRIKLHQEDDLPYKVISTRNLCSYIKDYPSKMSVNDRTEFITRMGELIAE